MLARIFTVTHALYFIVVGGGMLVLPHEVSEFFYPNGMQPAMEKSSGTGDDEIANVNLRAYGLAMLSWQVLLLGIAYLNEQRLYAWAILSLSPYNVGMLVMSIIEMNNFLVALHALILVCMFAVTFSLTPIMQRLTQSLGRALTQPVGGSTSVSAAEKGAASSAPIGTSHNGHHVVRMGGGGDFGRIGKM